MKRCKFCGREGSRMTPIRNRWIDRIDGWKCTSPIACIRRQEQLGQWIGKRVVYRQDADGTRWTIRRATDGTWCLQMQYRDHVMSASPFNTAEAAQAHVDDVLASWSAQRWRDYVEAR